MHKNVRSYPEIAQGSTDIILKSGQNSSKLP